MDELAIVMPMRQKQIHIYGQTKPIPVDCYGSAIMDNPMRVEPPAAPVEPAPAAPAEAAVTPATPEAKP